MKSSGETFLKVLFGTLLMLLFGCHRAMTRPEISQMPDVQLFSKYHELSRHVEAPPAVNFSEDAVQSNYALVSDEVLRRLNKFPKDVQTKILERQLWIGMTTEQLVLSAGLPSKINKTISKGGSSEQWVYYNFSRWPRQFVYVTGGVVEGIQQ